MRAAAAALLMLSTAVASPPNVIVVLCDDLGRGDVKCYNPEGKIATPNLDRFAADGMKFTDAHSGSAVCTPTRYGLMTGRYAWRTPLQKHVLGGLSPRLIEKDRETLASYLKKQGYQTGCVGKWHLGMDWTLKPGGAVNKLAIETREQVFNVQYDQPIANGPTSVGFDWYFGISASLDMVPYAFIENDRVVVNPTEDKGFPLMVGKPALSRKGPTSPGFTIEAVLPTLTAKACDFISKAKADKPFFLYLPLASPHTDIAPTPEWLGKSGLNPYADFVMQTDAAIGELLATLEKTGRAKDTLVIVTSDNGCSPQADFPVLLAKGHNSNFPFRGHKADIFEGGHRVPFLVRWPGTVKPGSVSDSLIGLGDIFATCADALGQKLPDNCAEDSISFLPVLLGEKGKRESLVHHSINGSFAIRDGQWKLCFCPGSGGWSAPRPGRDDQSALPPIQLFDLTADLAEKTNVQAENPQIVARLTKQLEEIVANGRSTPGAKRENAVPVDIRAAGREAMKATEKKKKN